MQRFSECVKALLHGRVFSFFKVVNASNKTIASTDHIWFRAGRALNDKDRLFILKLVHITTGLFLFIGELWFVVEIQHQFSHGGPLK